MQIGNYLDRARVRNVSFLVSLALHSLENKSLKYHEPIRACSLATAVIAAVVGLHNHQTTEQKRSSLRPNERDGFLACRTELQ